MKKIFTLFWLLLFTFSFSITQAQAWLWSKQPGSNHAATSQGDPFTDRCIAVDKAGNAYETGLFAGTLIFGSDTVHGNGGYEQLPYLAKYDPNGHAIWGKQGKCSLTTTMPNAFGMAVATDGSNNIYEVGQFSDTLIFGSYILAGNMFSSPYIVKYDNNGNILWAKQGHAISKLGWASGNNVSADVAGNTYMTGYFKDTLIFGDDTLRAKSRTRIEIYFVKYDPNGNVIWAKQTQGTSSYSVDDYEDNISIALDGTGHAYLTGDFLDTLSFGGYALFDHSSFRRAEFLVKYDTSGNVIWAKQAENYNIVNSYAQGVSVAIDGAGNPYVAGNFGDTIIMDHDTLGCGYNTDIFLAKFDTAGHVIWAEDGGLIHTPQFVAYSLACDTLKRGGGYMAISGVGPAPLKIKFGGDTLGNNTGAEITILFQFDSTGKVTCINNFGEGGEDDGDGLAVDPTGGYIYIGGDTYNRNVIIGPDTLRNGGDYSFVARWKTCCGTPVTVSPIDTSICMGASVTFRAGGAVTYGWSPPVGLNTTSGSTVISTPSATTHYTVTGQNPTCAATAIATVIVNPVPYVSITPPQDTICTGASTTLTANGAVSYVWSPSVGLSCTTCANPTANPVVPTTYSVVGSNSFGCTDTVKINLVVSNKPNTVLTANPVNDSICNGDSAHLYVSGGTNYLWTPGNANTDSIWVKPTSNTTYSVAVDNNGCIADTTLSVKVSTPVNINITQGSTICFGDSTTLTATGGGTYKWSNNSTNNTIKVGPTSNTNYSVIVKNQACADSAKTTVTVDVPSISVCCNDTITMGSSVELDITGTGSFAWTPAIGLNCTNCAQPTASPTVTTTYTITNTDGNNCSLEKSITVYVEEHCADFTVPNVFTPNNDGINDDFVINASSATTYNITIYDRWGKQVYTSSNAAEYWNGRINGTENLAPDGTYYYIITASCGSNNYNKKGFVEVVGEK